MENIIAGRIEKKKNNTMNETPKKVENKNVKSQEVMEEERKSIAKKKKKFIQLGQGTILKRKPDWEDNK